MASSKASKQNMDLPEKTVNNQDIDIQTADAELAPEAKIDVQGADPALAYASAQAIVIDSVTNKKLLRKIDWHIMPWLGALYFLQNLDKSTLSYAGVMGIQKELNMNASQYNWVGSIYYLGYLVAAFPHNRLLQHFKASKYIAVCAILWGAILSCMAATHDFAGLMIVRVFMGVLEACVSCGFILLTAAWYRKYEHATRVAVWASCNGVSAIIGGLVAYGCVAGSEVNPGTALTSWRILSLCTGLLSVVYGFAMFYFLPTSILTAKFFSEEEKTLAIERLRENQQGIGSTKFKMYQVKECLLDIRTWLYVLFMFASQIPTGGISYLSSILIQSLGFDTKSTLLFHMPIGAVQIVSNMGFGYLADKTKQRTLAAIAAHLLCLFALGLHVGLANVSPLYERNGQLVAYFLLNGNSATSFFIVLSMISSNVLGTTKKTMTNGILFTCMAASYLIGPQIFVDPPYYYRAKSASIGLWALTIVILVALYLLNVFENRKRDRLAAAGEESEVILNAEFMDLTDKENKRFRYVE